MLSRCYRLKKPHQFNYVYRKGSKVSCGLFTLVYAKKRSGVQIGFSVSNKIGKAVVRNKVKRRLRHACKELMSEFRGGFSFVFVARIGIEKAGYADILRSVRYVLDKVNRV